MAGGGLKRNFVGQSFWMGLLHITRGWDEEVIQGCIREHKAEGRRLVQLQMLQ